MTSPTLQQRFDSARRTLTEHGQEHLLRFYSELDAAAQDSLLKQIESQDWPLLADLIKSHVLSNPPFNLPSGIEPAPCYPAKPTHELEIRYNQAREMGEYMLHQGQVAAFTVAGGQGTRLGWEGPKGTFPASPVSGKSLFQLFAEYLLKVERTCGHAVPWYIMTSPINDRATRDFFAANSHFGLNPSNIMFFEQGTLPSIGMDGKVLLESKSSLALNPDGHGGSLRALAVSGALADMARRGVKQISYFQVDNPLVKCIDPLFIGLHAMDGAQMSSKMVAKAFDKEKVGNFCKANGKIVVIEYSDMPDDLVQRRNATGGLSFNAGSIAIHVIAVDFVQALNKGHFALPPHRAVKKVPFLDWKTGRIVAPDAPNAVKLEMFVFDALEFCDRSVILEVERAEEFGPIKNADGIDSPATSKELQSDRACRWLQAAGVRIPWTSGGHADAVVELGFLTAIRPLDLAGNKNLPTKVDAGSQIVL